jgi:hypothetical protein
MLYTQFLAQKNPVINWICGYQFERSRESRNTALYFPLILFKQGFDSAQPDSAPSY